MPKIHLLGTGAAVTDPHRTTTMLAVSNATGIIAVDCGGDLVHRILAADLTVGHLNALLLSHEHADHTSGFPLFMEKIWLHGRRNPLPVFGPERALHQARSIFDTYDTSRWLGLPTIVWNPVEMHANAEVCQSWGWRISASPGDHGVPVIGFRFEDIETETVAVYSSDTAPCKAIAELSTGADLLVHEATGALKGHSSAEQAAEIARSAGVNRLVLVHLSRRPENELDGARQIFPGTEIGTELGEYPF